MISLTKEQFNKYRDKKCIFPVAMEMYADELTPISIFYSIAGKNKCLLESACNTESMGRYSFIGMNPHMTVTSKGREVTINRQQKTEKVQGDVLEIVKENLKTEFCNAGVKIPLTGGAIGYIGYDAFRLYEKLPDNNPDEIGIPEAYLMFYREIICYDHYKHLLYIIHNVQPEEEVSYEEVLEKLESIYSSIKENRHMHELGTAAVEKEVSANVTEEEFCNLVEKAKEYIKRGDIFQVVLSQRLTIKCKSDSFQVYRRLRSKNPSPYLYYIDFEDFQVVGSSPERLVSVNGSKVTNNPIAGTRPRGLDDAGDEKMKAELLQDEKERAEHVMLVDLGRNDVGKISEFGSVRVNRFMDVDYYSHVMHMVSTVEGTLKKGNDCFDALRACLPAGTVSGAPKIRAMEIIDELENVRRGAYAGAVGYFSYSGNMDTCIAIRTIIFKGDRGYLQAGAGIVYDSVPKQEYIETLNKAMALKEVI